MTIPCRRPLPEAKRAAVTDAGIARQAWTRPRSAVLAAGVVLLTILPGEAASQAPAAEPAVRTAPGMVTARTFSNLPEGFTVAVSPYDDSELNLTLKGDFEAALIDRWQAKPTPEAAAAYLLLFEAGVVPAEQAPNSPNLGSVRADEEGAEVNVNVWSSGQDSVLGGRKSEGPVGSTVFQINAVLRDRKSGDVAWQGDAYYILRQPETEQVARALVVPLVDKIGQSVAREPLEIE